MCIAALLTQPARVVCLERVRVSVVRRRCALSPLGGSFGDVVCSFINDTIRSDFHKRFLSRYIG